MSGFENKAKDLVSRGDANPLGLYTEVTTVTSDYTASHGEVVLADSSSGAITITLPEPNNTTVLTVKKTDSSGNAVNIATPGSENIDGNSSISVTNQYTSREVVSDSSDYFIK